MASVPVQEITVARYEPTIEKIDDKRTGVKGWLTKNTTENIPWVLRVLPEFAQEVNDAFPGVLDTMKGSRNVGCVNGTALLETSFKVCTVGGSQRPAIMYRAIHSRQPNDGIKSRLGRGSDPIFPHIHLRKHLRWLCREPSPFLSATSWEHRAFFFASLYEQRGHQDIKVVKFRTDGPGWDHNVQRVWDARRLLRQLRLKKDDKRYIKREYLIEDSIPQESIIKTYNWTSHKRVHDPFGYIEAEAKCDLEAKEKKNKEAKEQREAEKDKKKCENEESEDSVDGRKPVKRIKIGPKMGPNLGE